IEFLVVRVDFLDGLDAWIFGAGVLLAGFFLVPIINATDERRDQLDTGVGARDRLGQGKEESQVAMYTLLFESFSGTDSLPGRSDFNQDPFAIDPFSLVKVDQMLSLGDDRFA